MSVLAQGVGRADLLIHRGISESFGVHWEQDTGSGLQDVDLSGWTITATLSSGQGDVWLTKTGVGAVNGIAKFDLAASDTSDPVWLGRQLGEWHLIGVSGARTELLGWGHFALA
jgi:hypothetical protein